MKCHVQTFARKAGPFIKSDSPVGNSRPSSNYIAVLLLVDDNIVLTSVTVCIATDYLAFHSLVDRLHQCNGSPPLFPPSRVTMSLS